MLKRTLVVLVLVTSACSSDKKPDQDSGLPYDAIQLDREPALDGSTPVDGTVDPDGPTPSIEWCNLQWPPSATIAAGGTMTAFGQVFVAGVTEGEGEGAGIEGQLGLGPVGSDGSTDAGWTWTDATYNTDEGNNDEYLADLSPPEGGYVYAYRFRIQDGPWLYCDLDGSENGFDAGQQGALTVESVPPPAVDWCTLQWPPSGTIVDGTPLTVYGQVYVVGTTEASGQGADVEGQLGHGPAGSDGSVNTGWTWTAAAYNKDEGNNDEYMGDISPSEGSYAYAYRFRFMGGSWLYCDLDGSQNSFDEAQQGALTVEPASQQAPWMEMTQVSAVENVGASTQVKAEIYLEGVTDSPGQGAGITAQLGHGPKGLMPSDASWSWQPATYAEDAAGGGTLSNDVYSGWLVAPVAGSYDVSIKFTWAGQDYFADTVGMTPGYTLAEAAHLDTFEAQDPPQNDVGWCDLHWPPTVTLAPGGTTDVFGQVFVQGITNPAGSGAGITGELGLGADGSDPRTAQWTWVGATYNTDAGNNDELMAVLGAPPSAGTYRYAFRFRYQGGWTYCDTDGSDGASNFDPASSGVLTVP